MPSYQVILLYVCLELIVNG
uniref:Uncharacterized protein n=1 Tax=Arundo donax TaxID=35708 RepID=A0A0A9A6Y3_ARUDO